MITDKEYELLNDVADTGEVSECCGASVSEYGFCSDCREGCG